ncbi:MAG TPA: hypothetical protein V6C84_04245 [Coleofasciculaceae cyanobacterium]|jgi:hypothetical protein
MWSVLLIGLAGCNGITTVKDVQDRPHRNWLTSTVRLQGTVGDRVPLIDAQVYQLQDSTGTIWVLTSRQDVRSGTTVLIKGQVRFQPTSTAEQTERLTGEEADGQADQEKAIGEAYIEEQQSEVVVK